jgi:hypothetical protein
MFNSLLEFWYLEACPVLLPALDSITLGFFVCLRDVFLRIYCYFLVNFFGSHLWYCCSLLVVWGLCSNIVALLFAIILYQYKGQYERNSKRTRVPKVLTWFLKCNDELYLGPRTRTREKYIFTSFSLLFHLFALLEFRMFSILLDVEAFVSTKI